MSKALLGVYGLEVMSDQKTLIFETSFELDKPEIVSIVGSNGSGKTTLLKAICGLNKLSQKGTVFLRGTNSTSLEWAERSQRVVYLGSDLRSEFPLKVFEVINLGFLHQGLSLSIPHTQTQEILKKLDALHLLHQNVQELSGGEQQLVLIARALAQGAKIIFLDETLSKMDLYYQDKVMGVFSELVLQGYLIIPVTHDLNFARQYSSRALFFHQGKLIAQGKTEDALSEGVIQKVYPHLSKKNKLSQF